MNCEYFCKKKSLTRMKNGAQIFFANGDYFELHKQEIADLSVTFYDELRAGERGFCPVAKSGFLKCKPDGRRSREGILYENPAYGKSGGKEYIEKRCVQEGGICYVRLFDTNNWHVAFYCAATARMEDGFLVFEFCEMSGGGSADKEQHTVRARNITKENVRKINLDFENCEGFEIFPQEIVEMELEFEKKLRWSSSCFGRVLRRGFIRLKLDEEITWRYANLWRGTGTVKQMVKRLAGKGRAATDICHLYVEYEYAGYGINYEECIELKDLRPMKEQEEDEWGYISGYAEMQEDGSVLIRFGK